MQLTKKMKKQQVLATFVRCPSSNQVIHEEKKITNRDIFNAQGAQRDELLEIINRRKNKRSPIKVRNDHILRLTKAGM